MPSKFMASGFRVMNILILPMTAIVALILGPTAFKINIYERSNGVHKALRLEV